MLVLMQEPHAGQGMEKSKGKKTKGNSLEVWGLEGDPPTSLRLPPRGAWLAWPLL